MKEIALFIFLFFLINCIASEPAAVINEVKISTGHIEIYNPTVVNVPNGYNVLVFDQDKALHLSGSVSGLPPNTCILFSFTAPPTTSQLLIIIYHGAGVNDYNSLTSTFVVDSFVFTFDGSSNAFSNLVPQWDNKVKQFSDGTSISRCSSNEGNVPESFSVAPPSLNVTNVCNSVGVNGDPHFYQTVYDIKTKRPINICFDVFGKSLQSVFILDDKFTKTKVLGILSDDYYFHEIHIIHRGNLIKINSKSMSYNDNQYDWNRNNILRFENVQLLAKSDEISIKTYYRSYNLTSIVQRSLNKLNYEHLDVKFENMDKRVSRYGGLLGDIGQKKIQILKGIQIVNEAILKINNQIIMAKLKKRKMKKCLFMNVHDLIKPNDLNYYIH